MTTEDMTRNANQIKEIVICSLEREGLLNRPSKEICDNYIISLGKPSIFGNAMKFVLGGKDDSHRFIFSKVVK